MNGIQKKIALAFIIAIIVIVGSIILTDSSTDKNIKGIYDGVVVTDKAGKSYMLAYKSGGAFNIKEFDIEKMRVKN